MILTALGYLGTVCIIAGIAGVGRKYRHALLFSIVGEAAYMAREVAKWPNVDWALLSLVAILLVVAADGWRRWQKAAEPEPEVKAVPVTSPQPTSATIKITSPLRGKWGLAIQRVLTDEIYAHITTPLVQRRMNEAVIREVRNED